MRDYKQSLEFKEIYMYTFRENGHLKLGDIKVQIINKSNSKI